MRIKIQVANEHLETLYKDVWELVYPLVANENKGVLYKVIHILLEAEKSTADDICTATGINKNASLNDDERIAGDQLLMEKPNPLNQFLKQNWLKQKMHDTTLNNLNNPDMVTVAWLVFIGSILVGAGVCIQYINRKSNARNRRGNGRNLQPDSLRQLSPEPITAALCLVVPASVFIDLRDKRPNGFTNNCLDTSDLKTFIDNASYFLCTDVENAASKEQFLEMAKNEDIPTNSNREVYIRIDINQGQEMIDKESPYILKRNLPNYGQRIIQKYACLRNLSGLENFNRI
ncbi:hypothetical protein NDA07_00490 [Microcoleus vaginatus DQ-U2]|uniref:hypothetical protein n=1 Tax=Microcoleus vaginatus TaxID=119532 RepID=UPI00168513E3|nr:hypothetical protein [Microcoleus sp. FACHB-DQ6]